MVQRKFSTKLKMGKNNYIKQRHCLCGKLITDRAINCNSCSNKKNAKKGKNAPNYIDGKWSKQYYCKCGKKIGVDSALRGQGRCNSCAKKGSNSPNYIDGRTLKQYYCINCGRKIAIKAYLYSSKRCRSCDCIERLKEPKNNPNWKGGLSKLPYSFEFTDELKENIRKRDNYTCQNCGIKEENYYRKLDIHHIDHNKMNSKEYNLITLCNKCNSIANSNRTYWQSFYMNKLENKICFILKSFRRAKIYQLLLEMLLEQCTLNYKKN